MSKTPGKNILYSGVNPHPGQLEVLNHPARFRVLDCGRRWGKSEELKMEMHLGASKSQRIAYCCPTNKMLAEMWRWARNTYAPVLDDKSEQEHRLELHGGGLIEFWSLDNPDGPRGREYDLILFDEAAVIPSGDVWHQVLHPTLINRGGKALFASTPKGFNWFWGLYKLGQDPAEPDWASWKLPTASNPYVPRKEIEFARRHTPLGIFSQEYEAEFISDASSVFRSVDEAARAIEQDAALPGHSYVFGVDLAKTTDFSVFHVYDVTINALVKIDRANHVNYKLQKDRLVSLAARFQPVCVVVEENTNLAFMEQLLDTGLPIKPFVTSAQTKTMIIEALAAGFDNRSLQILADPQLLDELHAYAAERLPSGQFRYGGPKDTHDDNVMALALAYHGATYNAPAWHAELIGLPTTAPAQVNPFPVWANAPLETPQVIEKSGWDVFLPGGWRA